MSTGRYVHPGGSWVRSACRPAPRSITVAPAGIQEAKIMLDSVGFEEGPGVFGDGEVVSDDRDVEVLVGGLVVGPSVEESCLQVLGKDLGYGGGVREADVADEVFGV